MPSGRAGAGRKKRTSAFRLPPACPKAWGRGVTQGHVTVGSRPLASLDSSLLGGPDWPDGMEARPGRPRICSPALQLAGPAYPPKGAIEGCR